MIAVDIVSTPVGKENLAGWWKEDSFTKLEVFKLVQYDRVLLMDADTVIAQGRNLDHLFDSPYELAAVPEGEYKGQTLKKLSHGGMKCSVPFLPENLSPSLWQVRDGQGKNTHSKLHHSSSSSKIDWSKVPYVRSSLIIDVPFDEAPCISPYDHPDEPGASTCELREKKDAESPLCIKFNAGYHQKGFVIFNTGLVLFKPSLDMHDRLLQLMSEEPSYSDSCIGGGGCNDQMILNLYFRESDGIRLLPPRYVL